MPRALVGPDEVVPTAVATEFSTSRPISAQCRVGSQGIDDGFRVRGDTRNLARRSWSTSAVGRRFRRSEPAATARSAAGVLRLLLSPLEIFGESARFLGIIESRQLGSQRKIQMFCCRANFADYLIPNPVGLTGHFRSERKFTIAGKLDSSLSSASLCVTA